MKYLDDRGMTDAETAAWIREWVRKARLEGCDLFSWPTDGCGYAQHIKFVNHRNTQWSPRVERTLKGFYDFCLEYADTLAQPEPPAPWETQP